MNKRIKLKKGILHKTCDKNCFEYIRIFFTGSHVNDGCRGCRYKYLTDKIIDENKKRDLNGKFICTGHTCVSLKYVNLNGKIE